MIQLLSTHFTAQFLYKLSPLFTNLNNFFKISTIIYKKKKFKKKSPLLIQHRDLIYFKKMLQRKKFVTLELWMEFEQI